MQRIEIDPLHLTDENNRLLAKYLKSARRKGLHLERGTTYWAGAQRITLTKDIYVREVFPGKWRYDVINDIPLARGSYGEIFRVRAVIHDAFSDPEMLTVVPKEPRRLYKVQPIDAWHEFELMQYCTSFRVRQLFPGNLSMISMVEFPGRLLFDYLSDERGTKDKCLNIMARYRLTLAILRAIKKLHMHGICHKDLKPKNMIYNEATNQIHIIDLGNAKYFNDKTDLRSRGNAIYASPEEFINQATNQPVLQHELKQQICLMSLVEAPGDVFSGGRVIQVVWRSLDPLFSDDSDDEVIKSKRANASWLTITELFDGIHGLTSNERESIIYELSRMTSKEIQDRPDIDSCINHFNSLYLHRKLSKMAETHHPAVISAHYSAEVLINELDNIECVSEWRRVMINTMRELRFQADQPFKQFIQVLERKRDYGYKHLAIQLQSMRAKLNLENINTIEDMDRALDSRASLTRLTQVFHQCLSSVPDNEYAVKEFVEGINVKCLIGIHSKMILIDKVNTIIEEFTKLEASIKTVIAQNLYPDKPMVSLELQHLLKKIHAENMTLDNVAQSLQRMERKLNKLFVNYQADLRHFILQP